MSPKKGQEYFAPGPTGFTPIRFGGRGVCYRVLTLAGNSRGYVSVRWLEGPLRGREARLEAKMLREVGNGG